MIELILPRGFEKAKIYVWEILLGEFIELIDFRVSLSSEETSVYKLILNNKKVISFPDLFFKRASLKGTYIDKCLLPEKIEWWDNKITEKKIPILYGQGGLANDKEEIKLNFDITGSVFFMLSRWEEMLNKNKDKHQRFPASQSNAFKHSYLTLPVVDFYVDLLKALMKKQDTSIKFNSSRVNYYITHDVDYLKFWSSFNKFVKVTGNDMLNLKPIKAIKGSIGYLSSVLRKENDPFWNFDWIMDQSERANQLSRFYFLIGGTSKYDKRYDPNGKLLKSLINRVKERGHVIGLHYTYNAYNNLEQLKKEKETLERIAEVDIVEGRNHYLRFDVSCSWKILDDANMKIDSTCGYADHEGYRCGTGRAFSVFDHQNNRKLKLKERPLIMMENTLFDYRGLEQEGIANYLKTFFETDSTILWHNSSIKYKQYFEDIVKILEDKSKINV